MISIISNYILLLINSTIRRINKSILMIIPFSPWTLWQLDNDKILSKVVRDSVESELHLEMVEEKRKKNELPEIFTAGNGETLYCFPKNFTIIDDEAHYLLSGDNHCVITEKEMNALVSLTWVERSKSDEAKEELSRVTKDYEKKNKELNKWRDRYILHLNTVNNKYKNIFKRIVKKFEDEYLTDELEKIVQEVVGEDEEWSDAENEADELDDVDDYNNTPLWKRRNCEKGMWSGEIKRSRYLAIMGVSEDNFVCTTCSNHMYKTAYDIDFCDDCCCGSCGGRKNYPGESHC
jgi:hypothetical protein